MLVSSVLMISEDRYLENKSSPLWSVNLRLARLVLFHGRGDFRYKRECLGGPALETVESVLQSLQRMCLSDVQLR